MSDSTPRETPLAQVHERLGATFTSFAGWRMPVHYSGHLREHAAVRTSVGLFDLSHMGELRVTGAQAARFLDYALVVHASAMTVGRARYTLLCTPSGGILDDLVVYRTGEEQFLVIANAANVATVFAEFAARAEGFAAEVADVSDSYALLSLQGPRAAEVLAPLTGTDLAAVKYYTCTEATVVGVPALLARTGYTGEDGFELYVSPPDVPAVWAAVQEAGEPAGIVPAGLACRDTLRLEAGMPLYGNELTVDVTPLHAGLGWAVPKEKPGDYVGRAALEKYVESGTPTGLVGLAGTGRRSPRSGYPVLDPRSGQSVGTVTSGALSPTLGYPVAMAYVPRSFEEPGIELVVDIRGAAAPVRVVKRPFYKRPAASGGR